METAVDELLRYDSPLQMFERWVLVDTEMGGVRLERGSKVGLLFGSANHDPEVFVDPERLDLARQPNPHVSFGAGLHYCVGAPLARVELEAALGTFASRVAASRADGGLRAHPLVGVPRVGEPQGRNRSRLRVSRPSVYEAAVVGGTVVGGTVVGGTVVDPGTVVGVAPLVPLVMLPGRPMTLISWIAISVNLSSSTTSAG